MKTLGYWLLFYCGLLLCDLSSESISSIYGNYIRKIDIQSDNPTEVAQKIYSEHPDPVEKISTGPGKFNAKRFSFEEIPIGIALQRVCDEFGLNMEFAVVGNNVELTMMIRDEGNSNKVFSHFAQISKKLQNDLFKTNTSLKTWLSKRGIQLDDRMDVIFHKKGNLYEIRTTLSEWTLVKSLLILTERNYKIIAK